MHQHLRRGRTTLRVRKKRLAEYGAIRSGLETIGKPIGGNDLLIAAHASAIQATVVTANASEFKRVRGLKVENWIA